MASNPKAVARALPRSGNSGSPVGGPGGFGGVPAAVGGSVPGGVSPLIASYDQWTQGRPYGTGLPRVPETFLSGAFGPLSPIAPVGIDTPDPQTGRPEPRRFDYPVAWNMPVGEPGTEGLKLAPFEALRTIADSYSVARACIELRKNEILGLEWDIVPTSEAQKAMRGSSRKHKDFAARRAEALKFFKRPDPQKYHTFNAWLGALLEDVLAIDALSIYLQPTRMKGKGLLGSSLAALCLIDGTTVRPLLDIHGGIPQPPSVAYQIYNYGVPRVDLMTALTGEDIKDMGDRLAAEYRGDQLLYLPYSARDWTPYGFTPLEQAIVPVMSGIQRQQYQLSYFADGSVPGMFISAGNPDMTPQQIRQLQDALNAMAGDPAWKHKIIVLPGNSKIDPIRPVPLADQFDEIVMTQVCMAYSVMPMELGISPKVSSTQSPGAANQMAKASKEVNQRKALRPMLKWLKDSIFDFVLQVVCGQTDMQWMWEGLEEGVDEESEVGLLIQEISFGLKSIDEARVQRGEQPWGLPLTSDPVYMTQTGITPIGSIDPQTGQATNDPVPMPQMVPGTGSGAPSPAPGAGAPPTGPAASSQPARGAAGDRTAAKPADPSDPGRTPSHDAAEVASGSRTDKMRALRELDLLRRRLGKGRTLEGWRTEYLPDSVWYGLLADLDQGTPSADAINKARQRLHGVSRVERRDGVINVLAGRTAGDLRTLADHVRSGHMSAMQFVDGGVTVMKINFAEAMRRGAQHALSDIGYPADVVYSVVRKFEEDPDDAYSNYIDEVAAADAEDQRHYLAGLFTDVLITSNVADWMSKLDSRLDLYGAATTRAYEAGYGLTSLAASEPGALEITWHATSVNPCNLCKANDGQTFTEYDFPGWPGSGGFGGVCEGGPNCHCWLEYSQPAAKSTKAAAAAASQLAQQIRGAREALAKSLPIRSTVKHQGHGDETHEVYAYLARHYPADVLEWVKDAHWHGPKTIQLVDIDMARRPGGARDEAKVDAMVRAIQDGTPPPHPIVVVKTPGSSKYEIVDGWHRTDAFKKAGVKTIKAWVGEVDTDHGPWGGGDESCQPRLPPARQAVTDYWVTYGRVGPADASPPQTFTQTVSAVDFMINDEFVMFVDIDQKVLFAVPTALNPVIASTGATTTAPG